MHKFAIPLFILSLGFKAQVRSDAAEKHVVVLFRTSSKPQKFDVKSVFDLHSKYVDSLLKVKQIINSGAFEGLEKYAGMNLLKESDLVKAKEIVMKDPGYGKLFEADFFVWHESLK